MVARSQQFGHAHSEIREAALKEAVYGRWNRVVDVGEEVLGVLAIEVVVTNRAVVGQASPGGRGRNGTPEQQPTSQ